MPIAQDELFSAVQARCQASFAGAAAVPVVPGAAPTANGAPPAKPKKEKVEKVKKEKPVWGEGKKKEAKKAEPTKEPFVNKTPKGEKKSFAEPIASGYEPEAVEASWDDWWAAKKFFTPDAKAAIGTHEENKFVMVIPPPNVTGSLHLGHAITTAIEDALTRWHRQSGKHVLWVPGTDHAGIATQSVVERILLKEEGLTRHDLGREEFLKKVYAWKDKYGNRICAQLRRLGASVDWTREAFTMDKNLTEAVKHAFVQFHEKGLIYRDNRLINWCSYLRTALSDLEVDYEEITGRTLKPIPGADKSLKVEVGVMCHFSYKVKGSEEKVTVATTRLETMLGDTAVAVHPEDERYKHLVGLELEHPFLPQRKMRIIADSYVDKDFGTGCVKITPAHDHNDFQMGKRHNLEFVNMLNDDGTVTQSSGGELFGNKHRYVVRREVEEELKKKGLWVAKKDHAMSLGFCSRSGDVIEPLLKPQWWMDCKQLAKESADAVREKELKIIPEFHETTWFKWLDNIRDWCISRQLWWGHRIPAYKLVEPKAALGVDEDGKEKEKWFVGLSKEEAVEKAKKELGVAEVVLEQDEDVLDTWFSSGLFPFSVMGWPHQTDDMKAFFPGSLLETGHDILFFWVARMVMMSLGLTGKLPFTTVYLHAMVRDKNGEKMSKSKGNVIDPLEVIDGASLESLHDKVKSGNLPPAEVNKALISQKKDFPEGIPACGADALRLGLLAYTAQGRNVNLDIQRVVGYRHFCNKLWNAVKFAIQNLKISEADGIESYHPYPGFLSPNAVLRLEDRWILSRLNFCCVKMNDCFGKYEFSEAVSTVYNFWLYELCDVYLELLKPRLYGEKTEEADKAVARDVLYTCLDQGLRLLHPMLPFVTEELYQRLPPNPNKFESICVASYPLGTKSWANESAEESMKEALELVKVLRSTKSALEIPNKTPSAYVVSDKAFEEEVLFVVKTLGKVSTLSWTKTAPAGTLASLVTLETSLNLDVKGMVDLAAHLKKLEKQLGLAQNRLQTAEKKTQAPNYEEKTPIEIREKNCEEIEKRKTEIAEIEKEIANVKKAI